MFLIVTQLFLFKNSISQNLIQNGSFTYINVCDEPISQLTISDLSGKIIYTTSIQNNSPIDLNLNHLTTGFYIAQVINKNSNDTFKLTINN